MRHFLLAAVYACCVGVFFANLLRDDLRSGLRLFLAIAGTMIASVLALGWLMYLLAP